jgi:arabinogalactan endo-1,4-beta-galactosidase
MNARIKILATIVVGGLMLGAAGPAAHGMPIDHGAMAKANKGKVLQNGADVSWLPTIEASGSKFYDTNRKPVDGLRLMKRAGLQIARVRLWVNPATSHGSLTEVLSMAKRIKAAGLKMVLDVHYSDWWADPAHQTKPAAWANLNQAQLVTQVHDYTATVLSRMSAQKTSPTWVQIGNEVGNGLLWPNGQLDQWNPAKFKAMTDLLNAGITASREVSPNTKVMIHLETSGDVQKTRGWLTNAFSNGLLKPDAVGLSYYSQWDGSLNNLSAAIAVVSNEFKLPVAVAETAYANTPTSNTPQVFDVSKGALAGFGFTPQGQSNYAAAVSQVLRSTAGSKAVGVWWWEAFSPNTPRLNNLLEPSQISSSSLVTGSGKTNRAMAALAAAQ